MASRRGRRRKPLGYLAIRDGHAVALLVREIRRKKRPIRIDRTYARGVKRMPAEFSRQLTRELRGRGGTR